MKRRRGFTLVEILVVLALVSLLVGGLTATFRTPFRRARQSEIISRLVQMDELARIAARRHAGAQLTVDPDMREVVIVTIGPDSKEIPFHRCSLGTDGTLTIRRPASSSSARRSGESTIAYDHRGCCRPYAVNIGSPTTTDVWVYFAGGSSQAVVTGERKEIDALLDR